VLAVGLYVCALLSKTITCSLPAAIVLLLWWKHGKISRRDALALVPVIALGLGFGLMTVWLEKYHVGAEGKDFNLSAIERFLIAGRALWFYTGKLVWPANLTFIYPRWKIDPYAWWQYAFPLAFLALLLALWQARHRIGRGPLVAVLYFAGTLVPALGFFDVYPMRFSFVADHFQYLASIGIISLAAATLTLAFHRQAGQQVWLPVVAGGTVLLILGRLTWLQGYVYADKPTLWNDTLAKNPDCWLAHDSLGNESLSRGQILMASGDPQEAQAQLAASERHFRKALAIDPHHAEGNCNLGVALRAEAGLDDSQRRHDAAKRKREEAIGYFAAALGARPSHHIAQENLGLTLSELGRDEEAKAAFRKVFEIEPRYGRARLDLGIVFFKEKRLEDAKREIQDALRVEPGLPAAHHTLGIIFLEEGKTEEARREFERELEVNPQHSKARRNLQELSRPKDTVNSEPRSKR
jgi:Flp pilus assembly protein TadD